MRCFHRTFSRGNRAVCNGAASTGSVVSSADWRMSSPMRFACLSLADVWSVRLTCFTQWPIWMSLMNRMYSSSAVIKSLVSVHKTGNFSFCYGVLVTSAWKSHGSLFRQTRYTDPIETSSINTKLPGFWDLLPFSSEQQQTDTPVEAAFSRWNAPNRLINEPFSSGAPES